MNQGLASAEQAGRRESEAWHLAGEEAREMHSRTLSLLECTRSLSLIVVRNAAAMRTAAGVSGAGGQGAPPASAEGGAGGDRTHQASVRAASEALAEFVQTLGGRPQADVPERWRRELLTSLVETAHSESEWAETVLANALGFAPSADAWVQEGSAEAAEPGGGAMLADELEYVSQRMAWSLQESPSGAAEAESHHLRPKFRACTLCTQCRSSRSCSCRLPEILIILCLRVLSAPPVLYSDAGCLKPGGTVCLSRASAPRSWSTRRRASWPRRRCG